MFLLSGSDTPMAPGADFEDHPASPSGGNFAVVGVPRLTVIAANVLHSSLLSDLTRCEEEMEAQELRWEREKKERHARREERKKQKAAGERLHNTLARHLGAILGRNKSSDEEIEVDPETAAQEAEDQRREKERKRRRGKKKKKKGGLASKERSVMIDDGR